jgi:hypothetical protein
MAANDSIIQTQEPMSEQEAKAEDLYLAERYAVALRFHGQAERAEDYEQLAQALRAELIHDIATGCGMRDCLTRRDYVS